MQRKRGELVPIGDVVGGLDGPVTASPAASPQARRGFTLFDQVDVLVRASETDPESGFIARWLMLCSLPRSNPGQRKEYVRRNGSYTLYMTVGGGCKLPFGNFPGCWPRVENFREGTAAPVVSAGARPRSKHGSRIARRGPTRSRQIGPPRLPPLRNGIDRDPGPGDP